MPGKRRKGQASKSDPQEPAEGDGGGAKSSVETVSEAMAVASIGQSSSTRQKYPEVIRVEDIRETEETKCLQPMHRPVPLGTRGREIKLYANLYPMTIPNDLAVQHYDLQFISVWTIVDEKSQQTMTKERVLKALPKQMGPILFDAMIEQYANHFPNRFALAYDGHKNLFVRNKLKEDTVSTPFKIDCKTEINGRMETFIIRLKWVAEINVDLRQVFDRNYVAKKSISTVVLDVILKQKTMFDANYIQLERRIFWYPEPLYKYLLPGGLVRYPGFWQSIRPCTGWKLMLNLDQANAAFVTGDTVLNIMSQQMKFDPKNLPESQFENLSEQLGSYLRVKDASGNVFEKKFSVAEYFNMQFAKGEFVSKVQYPNLPCIDVGNKDRSNMIPLEFCTVKNGQKYAKRLNPNQGSKMLQYASHVPEERKRLIEEDAQYLKYNDDPHLKAFGFTVDMNMVQVRGRVLTPPVIEYANKKTPEIKAGFWNMRDLKVLNGCTIKNFAVIDTVTCAEEEINVAIIAVQFDKIQCFIHHLAKDSVKAAGDVSLGVTTQCIKMERIQKASSSLLANLCLKINAKLGGTNSKLADKSQGEINHFLNEPILFIGADVNHPAPGDGDDPVSCAAVVSNMDSANSVYFAKVMLQHRQEVKNVYNEETRRTEKILTRVPQEWISDFKDAVKGSIYCYFMRNRCLPRRVIVYRDGVGDSMFLQVLTKELTAIRNACTECAMDDRYKAHIPPDFGGKYEPPITFVIVQKRHHVRLFPVNPMVDGAGRGKNIPPGTTVDTGVTHPEEFDFYQCSHLGLQGTSKPTHYSVLWDDNNFSADDLQTLTYYLCHTYARATCSVSIPPPCYYADLVAYRARQHLDGRTERKERAHRRQPGSVITQDLSKQLQRFVEVNPAFAGKGMFFM